ncbi:unnamed protein product [Phytomonas sp. Hart1]|nr:unnamed protein product [Phytomonas sp. Hart1]|eukprot:CCW69970.1 unnamed protein product [Phytomonas sp. isolate Hart1]
MFAATSRAQTIGVSEFKARRRHLLSCLDPNTLLIILASDEVTYSQDILYPHRQNSLFHHLFGLQEPLRRMLSPPTSIFTNDVRLTCGAFMKTDSGSKTFLFVPPQTTDPLELTWASQPKTLEDFKRIHLGLCKKGEQNHATAENHKNTVEDLLWSECVRVNDIRTISGVLYREIQASAQERWTNIVNKHSSLPFGEEDRKESGTRLLYKVLDPLPQLLIEFPPQIRWTKQHYRLEVPLPTTKVKDSTKNCSVASHSVAFRHPLEALMGVLLAFRFEFVLPPALLTSLRQTGPPPALVCSYYSPPPLRAWCGVSPHDNTQQEHIRQCLALDGSACTIKTAACGMVKRTAIRSADDTLCRYRLLKSPKQIAEHVWSAVATRQAFQAVMRRAACTTSEHSITVAFHQAILTLSERMGPGVRVNAAYIPVVASGVRATEIHYTCNSGDADKGDLLRFDGGVEVNLVPTDCTRTFPVCQPSFTTIQKRLYGALLQIQQELIQSIQSGLLVSEVSKKHIESTKNILEKQLGVRGVTENQVRTLFCAHGFGHLMGLDIHEQFVRSKDKQSREFTFLGGMVHTIEPGLYLPDANRANAFNYDLSCVPQALRGVGLQIEDDVLILPRFGDGANEQSPWSRLDYLNEILRVVDELLKDEDYIRDCVFLRDDRLQRYKTYLTHPQFDVLYFLFLQRTSLFGLQEAIEALSLDATRVQRHFTERRPIIEWVPPSCGWYPFEVVVLTACIPKEIPHIEDYMSRNR